MKKLVLLVASMAMSSVAMSAHVKVGMELTDESISSVVAFDKALIRAIAERTGDTYEIVKVPLGRRLQYFLEGEVDMLPGIIKREQQKNKDLIFSAPYLSAEVSTILKKSEVTSTKQLKNKLVCVASADEKSIADSFGAKALITERQDKYSKLEEGKCVAAIASRHINEGFLNAKPENKKLYIHKHKLLNFFLKYRFVSTKDKKDIMARMTAAIKVLQKNGTLKALEKKYFTVK